MKTIQLSNHYEGEALRILQEAVAGDFELRVLERLDVEELKSKAADADYLLVSGRMKISAEVLGCAGKLRMIQRTGVGLDNMDLDCIRARGIPLYVNQGVNSTSVAEYTVYLMLAALRRSFAVNSQIRAGVWRKQATGLTTHELCGKTVGIVGMGNIGTKVARMLSAFDVKVRYFSVPRLPAEDEARMAVEFCSFEELLETVDILTFHCPAGDGPMLGQAQIEQMRDGAIVVNTARGGLIDMQALVGALESGKLSAAGIDVYDEEPISAGHGILACENAVLSPHIAGVTYEAFRSMMGNAIDNIRRFDAGALDEIAPRRYL